jgi:hypothetical protein
MHSHGAMFCEVRVNEVTGETRVSRFLGSFDCGRILNAKTAASQFRGGIVMGLGLALMEETQFDERNGRIMNPSLAEYHVPVHMDVPEIDVMWTDIPDPHAPMGARGIGEIGITGVGAAVANAVFNACGKRVRDLPITLDKLMADRIDRQVGVGALELLQASDIGLGFGEPFEQAGKTAVDAVDVECGDLHRVGRRGGGRESAKDDGEIFRPSSRRCGPRWQGAYLMRFSIGSADGRKTSSKAGRRPRCTGVVASGAPGCGDAAPSVPHRLAKRTSASLRSLAICSMRLSGMAKRPPCVRW